ncbi:MAG: DUF1822 family protein [Calothrix sp. FI2-JRJ7]|jgi:hypothetical protein|nr:DUF1822 family protein [Calothrix sp. FI2-JRJ7]
MTNLTISTFTAPISTVSRRLAEKWSRQQATAIKSQQVLLNTLSVSFVKFYLDCMGFETDLEASDSWNAPFQTLLDVADLYIQNIGNLECRPVLENAQFVHVPREVQSNRIGYVAVEISKSLDSAKLLGFVREVSTEDFPINQLQPLENLLKHLEYLETQEVKLPSINFVNLKTWIENIADASWRPIESIFITEPAWQFRNTEEGCVRCIERAKLINFQMQASKASVVIVVRIFTYHNLDEMKIIVELRPTNGEEYLPQSLHVMILDEEEAAVMEAIAKNDNKKIELEFSVSVGDTFSVKIDLGDISVIENFVV